MRDKDGVLQSGREEIAIVFEDFYEDLYTEPCPIQRHSDATEPLEDCNADHITVAELKCQLKKMAKDKSSDGNGMVVELLQWAGDDLIQLIASVFTDILKVDAPVPKQWKVTKLKVLLKKGELTTTGLYLCYLYCTSCSLKIYVRVCRTFLMMSSLLIRLGSALAFWPR